MNKNKKIILSLILIILATFSYSLLLLQTSNGKDPLAQLSGSTNYYSGYTKTTTTTKTCDCPYRIIAVSGTNSEGQFHKWMEDNFGEDIIKITNTGGETSSVIKSEIEKELEKEKPQKLLIVGHSSGSTKVFNIVNESQYKNCIETVYIDPPTDYLWCRLPVINFTSTLFNSDAKNICKAANDGIDESSDTISLTDGTGKPAALHDPFKPAGVDESGKPAFTEEQLEALAKIKKEIQGKINSCQASVIRK